MPAIDPKPVQGKATDQGQGDIYDKLRYILDFHTSRRMAPGTKARGVSISSQRRWLRYWARMLDGQDPRPRPSLTSVASSPMRLVRLEYIRVHLTEGQSGWTTRLLGSDHISVQVRTALGGRRKNQKGPTG